MPTVWQRERMANSRWGRRWARRGDRGGAWLQTLLYGLVAAYSWGGADMRRQDTVHDLDLSLHAVTPARCRCVIANRVCAEMNQGPEIPGGSHDWS